MSAVNALLKAIHARLSGDGDLVTMTGGRVMLDRLADRTPLPLIALGQMENPRCLDLYRSGERSTFLRSTSGQTPRGDARRRRLPAGFTPCSTMRR